MVIDPNGNTYVTGYTYGDFAASNTGGADVFIMKVGTVGNVIWKKQIGTAQDDAATALHVISGNRVLVAGYTFGGIDGNTSNGKHDMFVMEIDASGNITWSSQFGTSESDIANSVTRDSSGNIYIAGYTNGSFGGFTNNGGADVAFVKLDSAGNVIWIEQLGTAEDDQAFAIERDSMDDLYIAGTTQASLNGNTHAGGADQFLLKYDASGGAIWSLQQGSGTDDRGLALAVDHNDDVVIAGYTYGAMDGVNLGKFDIVVSKFDSNGTNIWTTQTGTEEDDFGFGITVSSDNDVYVTGYTTGDLDGNQSNGEHDALLMKWDSDGNKQ